jgi:hypothetical protein
MLSATAIVMAQALVLLLPVPMQMRYHDHPPTTKAVIRYVPSILRNHRCVSWHRSAQRVNDDGTIAAIAWNFNVAKSSTHLMMSASWKVASSSSLSATRALVAADVDASTPCSCRASDLERDSSPTKLA